MSAFRAITAAASAARSGRISGSVASAAVAVAVAVARQDVNIPSSGLPVVSPVSNCFYARKNQCARAIPAVDLGSSAINPVVRRSYGGSVIGLPPVATRLFTSKPTDTDTDTSVVPPPPIGGDISPPPPVDGDTYVPLPSVNSDTTYVPPPSVNGDTSETPINVSPWRKIVRYGSENFGDTSYWTAREGFFLMTFSLFVVSQITGIWSHGEVMTSLENGFNLASINSSTLFEAVKAGFEEALKEADSPSLSDEDVKAIAETVADAVAKKIEAATGSRTWWRFW